MAKTPGMRYQVKLDGVGDILRQSSAILDPKQRLALQKKGIRAAGNVLLKFIRRELRKHDRTGWLRKTMKSKLVYFKKTGTLVLIVGVQSKATKSVQVEQRLGRSKKYVTKNITSHNYAHLVLNPRRAFTQEITYTTRLGKVVRMTRHIAAYKGDNIFESATKIKGAAALAAMQDVITQGITLI